ncbi:translation initiation factor 2 [Lachnospiraceae bacterium 47-T17]
MKGSYKVVLQNKRVKYEFTVRRNITIIRGDSATGKTTLISMVAAVSNPGSMLGVTVECEKRCVTFTGIGWRSIIEELHDCIIFLDEEHYFITSEEFASVVKRSDNYFVLITRQRLENLPYSIEEIYGIRVSGKYSTLKQVYNEFFHLYHTAGVTPAIPKSVIVEDSNSGYEFFKNICDSVGVMCSSAYGKSNIKRLLITAGSDTIVVIADGAAIGSEVDELFQYMAMHQNVKCYFPESFEWVILKAGLMHNKVIQAILRAPENYIDSADYFSWERYFTKLLIQSTKDTYLRYSKNKLNPVYLQVREKKAILSVMSSVIKFENNRESKISNMKIF